MKAEIITIGDELLIGQTVDTNSAWIGSEMSKLGFDLHRITSIHDKREDILNEFNKAIGRSDVTLITGGLGPTSDDITKGLLCEFFNTRMVMNNEVLSMIENLVKKRSMPLNENNRRQAEVPESCRVLYNATGTAPGMWFEKDGKIFVSMPGVPYEMKYIMGEHVIPELKKRFVSQVIIHRNIMTYGEPEARLAEMLTGFEENLPREIKLAYLPSAGIIKLRLTATGQDKQLLTTRIEEQVKNLYRVIPQLIYAENEESLQEVIGKLLLTKHQTISTAESCTGGRIAEMITSIPGSSNYFRGSVVAYDNSVKIKILGVDEDLVKKHGAVSREVVTSMADNCRKLLETDFAIATSGIAGPDGGTDEKPVGTVWIAISSKKGTIAVKYVFGNFRSTNIDRFSIAALNLARKQIISE